MMECPGVYSFNGISALELSIENIIIIIIIIIIIVVVVAYLRVFIFLQILMSKQILCNINIPLP